jgi:hypothetical protein
MLLVFGTVGVGACAGARTQSKADAASGAATSVEVLEETRATSSVGSTEVPRTEPSGAESVEVPTEKTTLPIVCEAYFARFRHCLDATMRKHPDEATRAEVRKQFDKAEQRSRAMMSAGMEANEAEAYCKQALVALTASPCE